MTSVARWLSALAVALVWIYVGASVVRVLVPVYERMVDIQAFDNRAYDLELAIGEPLAWLLAAALLLGCVIAWRIVRAGPLDAEARAQRSSLAVWPGWPLCIVGVVLAGAALVPSGLPPDVVFNLSIRNLDGYAFAAIPLTLAAAAGATGGRGNQAAAFLAAPTILLVSVGLVGVTSITRSAVAVLLSWAALAGVFAVLASITGRELLVWLAIGFASLTVMTVPLAMGLFTPTEVLAVICVLAVANGLLLYSLVEGAVPWRLFTVGAVEILAVGTVWAFVTLASLLLRRYGTPAVVQDLLTAIPSVGVGAMAVAAMFVASFLLTPVVAAILVVAIFAPSLATLAASSLLLTLAGIAAMCLRAIDWKPGAEPASSLRLSPAAGLGAVAALLAVAALTVLFWDRIAIVTG